MKRAILLAAALVTVVGVTARDAAASPPLCVMLFESAVPVKSCVLDDLTTRVTNRSNVVIWVEGVTPWTQMSPLPYSLSNVSALATYLAVPTNCPAYGPCLLAPGKTLEVWNHVYTLYRYAYSVDFQHTIARNTTLALMRVAKRKLLSALSRSATVKAVKCARNVASLAQSPQSWSTDVFDGVTTFDSCKDWWDDVRGDPAEYQRLGQDTVDAAETDVAGGDRAAGWLADLDFFGKLFHG